MLKAKSLITFLSTVTGLYLSVALTLWQTALAFDYLQPLPDQPLVPKDNPLTEAKIQLGKRLFFDVNLSKSRSHSCNYCHNVYNGGDDDRAFSISPGSRPTPRSAPGLWNIGLQTVLYWDGRVKTLEEQAKDHLFASDIMAIGKPELLKRLQNKAYQSAFIAAFGNKAQISVDNVAKALASFERALMSPNSPFDQYLRGNKNALSEMAVKGMDTFNQMGCLACHFGVNFAGPAPGPAMTMGMGFYELFPNIQGSSYDQSLGLLTDKGRYEFSKDKGELYMWRVPPLRNIALTGPYFHNGSAKSLREAIKVMGKTQFGHEPNEEQVEQIAAFLRSLTGEMPKVLR